MIFKTPKDPAKKDFYRLTLFIFINYLMAVPFFYYMIGTLDWKRFYLPYTAALIVFSVFVVLFILVFLGISGTLKKLGFAFLWVLSSSVFLETFVLFLNNTRHQDTMITIGGDYSVFMPVWLVMTLVEFLSGIFLLKQPLIALSKVEYAIKFIINSWGLCAVVLIASTSNFLLKALLPTLMIGWLLTYFLATIKSKIASRNLRFFYEFACINIFTIILASIGSIFMGDFGQRSFIINLLYNVPAFVLFFLPIALFILIVNEKL